LNANGLPSKKPTTIKRNIRFRDERLRRDALPVPDDDGLTEFEPTRFAQ
jgi:hypothetical protein